MKDTSTRRELSIRGDRGQEVFRIANEYKATAAIRLAPDPQEYSGPAAHLTVDRDHTWKLVVFPRGRDGYGVLHASGVLGDDQADALPAAGDVVEVTNTSEPYTRRVTACDPDAVLDGNSWFGPGTVTTDDGITRALRDVLVIERAHCQYGNADINDPDALVALVDKRMIDDPQYVRTVVWVLATKYAEARAQATAAYTREAVAALDMNDVHALHDLLSARIDNDAPEGFADNIRETLDAAADLPWAADAYVTHVRFPADSGDEGYSYDQSAALVYLADGDVHVYDFGNTTVHDQLIEITDVQRRTGHIDGDSVLCVDMKSGTVQQV